MCVVGLKSGVVVLVGLVVGGVMEVFYRVVVVLSFLFVEVVG